MKTLILSFVTASLLCTGLTRANEDVRPNILFILADDMGYGDLACYGADDIATPHIDRMALEGTKFTSFYVSPVCSPTRASLMTGCIASAWGSGASCFPGTTTG